MVFLMTLSRFVLIISFVLLSSCNGSSSSNETTNGAENNVVNNTPVNDTPPATLLSGRFIDAPVEGLDFHTSPSNNSGITDSSGTFTYEPGDTEITFKLASVGIGSTTPKDIVTPYDTSGAEGIINGKVLRTARLLQSLDDDNDPSNGILITEETKATFGIGTTEFDLDLPNSKYEAAYSRLLENAGKSDVGISSAESHLIENTQQYRNCSDYPEYDIFFADISADCAARRRLHYYLNVVSKQLRDETSGYTSLIKANEDSAFDKRFQEGIVSAGGTLKRLAEVIVATRKADVPELDALNGFLLFASGMGSFFDAVSNVTGIVVPDEDWAEHRGKMSTIVTAIVKSSDCVSVLESSAEDADKYKCIEAVTKTVKTSALLVDDEELVEKIVLSMDSAELIDKAFTVNREYKKYEESVGKKQANLILSALDLAENSFILGFNEMFPESENRPALSIFRDSIINIFNTVECWYGFPAAKTSWKSGKTDGITEAVNNCVDALVGTSNTILTSMNVTRGGIYAKDLDSRTNEIILTQLVIEEWLLHGNETALLRDKWQLGSSFTVDELVIAVANSQGLSVDHFGALDFGWLLQKNEYSPRTVSHQVVLWLNYIWALEESELLVTQTSEQPVLTINDATSSESNNTLNFELNLSEPASDDISLTYTTFQSSGAGSAKSSVDFEATSGKAIIKKGESSTVIDVPIYDDDELEQQEYLKLHVIDDDNKVLIINSVAVGIITDNEPLAYTTNLQTDTSLINFKGLLYALVGTTTGFEVKQINPETLESLTVFKKDEESSSVALGRNSSGIHVAHLPNNDYGFLNIYQTTDGANWSENDQVALPSLCSTKNVCQIKANLHDAALDENTIIINISWFGRYALNLNNGEYAHISKSPSHYSIHNNQLLSLYGTKSQSAGNSRFLQYKVTNLLEEETEVLATFNSFWASTNPIAVNFSGDKYEYLWTGRGSNESSRQNHYGADNQAKIESQSCDDLGANLGHMRTFLVLGSQNGSYFEHRVAIFLIYQILVMTQIPIILVSQIIVM